LKKKKKHNPDKRGGEQEAERQREIDWESERGRVLRYYAQQRRCERFLGSALDSRTVQISMILILTIIII